VVWPDHSGSSVIKNIVEKRKTKLKRRVPVTALIAWPSFRLEMEDKVDKQVAAPAETRTPNLHRAKNRSHKSADGRVAPVATRQRENLA
jgi:hypothetical protein